MILFLLLFLSSGFVATATMPTGLRQFAEYQPFTPVADTVRGLPSGAAIGDHAIAAIAWSIGIAVVAYLWAIRLYSRRRRPRPSERGRADRCLARAVLRRSFSKKIWQRMSRNGPAAPRPRPDAKGHRGHLPQEAQR
jgi:hypothetical protein